VDGFASIGIQLDAVLQSPRPGGGAREIFYVEYGVGGGASQAGRGPAISPAQVGNAYSLKKFDAAKNA